MMHAPRRGRLGFGLVLGFILGVAAAVGYLWLTGSEALPPGRPLAEHPPVSVTFGEPFLTAVIRRSVASAPMMGSITDLVIQVEPGAIVVKGNVEVLGRPSVATATVRPVVRSGRLRFDVVSTNLGDLPVPVEQMLEDQINTRVRALLADLPVEVTGVSVVPERGLVITFRVDLDQVPLPHPP